MSTSLPRMLRVKQKYPDPPSLDLAATIQEQFGLVRDRIKPGLRVAVAVGSRGITNLQRLVAAVVENLKGAGVEPFILPAMGSHGGGTAEGQTELLAGYGITERVLNVPFRAAMEVEQVGATAEGIPVCCSVEALRAAGIVLINRIKPHTDFSGNIGSGIMKMMVVGLGKRVGAAQYHVAATRFGYEPALRSIARVLIQEAPILCGVGVVENQRHETDRVRVLAPEQIERGEDELFQEAKRLMPKLPFDDIDLLIIDWMGKNVSGSGMDPNIIGRGVHGYSSFLGQKEGPPPRVKRIFVRDLTPETHGNAIGVGFADVTTTRLVEGMDRAITYLNALTALTPHSAKIPIHFDTDQEALRLVLDSLAIPDTAQARVVRIQDTLALEQIEVSEVFLPLMRERTDLEIKSEPRTLRFDAAGNLPPLAPI